jgi:hypothetical protein
MAIIDTKKGSAVIKVWQSSMLKRNTEWISFPGRDMLTEIILFQVTQTSKQLISQAGMRVPAFVMNHHNQCIRLISELQVRVRQAGKQFTRALRS